MAKVGTLTLINETYTNDSNGIPQKVEESHEIYCECSSVTRNEFFEGGRNGLNPELQFRVFTGDYDDQVILEYEGKRYGIYRTFVIPGTDYMELYAQRQGGRNG